MVAPVGLDWPALVSQQIQSAGLSDIGLPLRNLPSLHNRVVYEDDGSRNWTLFNGEEAFDTLSPTPADIPAAYRRADAYLILAMTLPAQANLVTHIRQTTDAVVALDPQEDYIDGNEEALQRLIS
jgi:hypothetical protein